MQLPGIRVTLLCCRPQPSLPALDTIQQGAVDISENRRTAERHDSHASQEVISL